ncbi:MAG: BadF/BadG/BcrA/BcrD ATPase family protein, partial [candidate division FCPU426 bacterium]
MAKTALFLGMDGGASKTAGAITDSQGRILARGRVAGAVIEGRPPEASCRTLLGLLRSLCKQAGIRPTELSLLGLGLSGADYDDEMPMQQRVLAKAFGLPDKKLLLKNDGVVALWGASPEPAVVMLQFGTAFTAAWRGSYGDEAPFDNLAVGRPFDIRSELTAIVARMIDGREKTTPLMAKTLKHYGVNAAELGRAVYEKKIPFEKLSTTPPLVFASWQAGDPAAKKLVEALAADMALAAKVMGQKTGKHKVVTVLGGGVLSRGGDLFFRLVGRKLG